MKESLIMKKFREYGIERISDNKIFLWYTTTDYFNLFYKKLTKELNKINFNGTLFVDQLALTHNGYNRFFKIDFKDKSFDFNSAKHIKGNNKFRKITSNFFYNNREYIDKTILYKREINDILNNKIV